MRRILVLLALFLVAFALLCPGAAAQEKPKPQETEQDLINPDRPGIADGSTVIGRKRFQIEWGIQKEFRSAGGMTEHRFFLPTLIRFGINEMWEGRVEGNGYTWARTLDPATGKNNTDGYSPVSLGFKYHWQNSKGIRHPSLGTILRLFVPSGSSDFRSHRFQGDLRLAADCDLSDSWSLNPNLGLGVYDDGRSGVFTAGLFAVTLNYFNRTKTVNPFVDMGLQGPEEKRGRTSVILDTGAAFIVNPNMQLDVSVGTGILGRTPPHPFWSVGISIRR